MKLLKILPLFLLLLLVGCRSSKSALEGTGSGLAKTEAVFMEKVVDNRQRAKAVTAKMNMELKAMDKDLSVGGKLRMKRDEVIQMSLTILGFEVGRLEFTPQHVLLVDRVNKQYVKADYNDVSFLQQTGIDFHTLQSLFWNELFIPGQYDVVSQLSRFHYAEAAPFVKLEQTGTPKLNFVFLVQLQEAIVNKVIVTGKGKTISEPRVEWNYDRFTQLDHRKFPSYMQCQIMGLDKEIEFSLSLSRLDNDDNWPAETRISSKYRERNVEEILQQLLNR